MRNIFFLLFLAIMLSSCDGDPFESIIKLDPPPYDKKIALQFRAGVNDTFVDISLSRNFGILETPADSAFFIKNLNIEILESDQVLWQFNSGNDIPLNRATIYQEIPHGLFKSGKTYEIRASHPDFTSISAKQTIPEAPAVDSVRYDFDGGINSNGDEVSAFEVYLNDPAGVENFYQFSIGIISLSINPIYDSNNNVIGYDTLRYGPYDGYFEVSDDPNQEEGLNGSVLVGDQFFDGQAQKISLKIYKDYSPKEYVIYVRSITEDDFIWQRSLIRYEGAQDNPLSDPVLIYSNFKDGIGIFGLYNQRNFKVN
ncbi:MAG: DUF4249 domain-containing protein [Saprospiraceae bacterium]|nr:DUF4249 domain-containing protein [Saprospiraceae bacterium]